MRKTIHTELVPDAGLLKLISDWSACLKFAYAEFEGGRKFEKVRSLMKQGYQCLSTRQISDAVYIARFRWIKQKKIGKDLVMWARGDKTHCGNPTLRIAKGDAGYLLRVTIGRRRFNYYELIYDKQFEGNLNRLIESGVAYNVFLNCGDNGNCMVNVNNVSDKSRRNKLGVNTDSNLLITCKLCGAKLKRIASYHLNRHGITLAEYRILFPNAEVSSQIWKDNLRKCAIGRILSKETREKLSNARRKNWANPTYRDRQLKLWMSALTVHPNKPERLMQELLNELQPNEWKFNDGWFILVGKIPDFVNINHKKKLIDLFGTYWHERDEEQPRKDLFKKYGYETLIIWEDELSDIDTLVLKLRNFVT